MEFISGIVWRSLQQRQPFDTLNNRSPGQYDIRLGSADYSAFFDGLPARTPQYRRFPARPFPSPLSHRRYGRIPPLVVRYKGNDSSRRDWNIPSQRSATAYSLWRPDCRLPDAPSDKELSGPLENIFRQVLRTADPGPGT